MLTTTSQMKHDLWGLPLTLSINIFYYTNFIARDSTLLFFMGEWYTIIYFTFFVSNPRWISAVSLCLRF